MILLLVALAISSVRGVLCVESVGPLPLNPATFSFPAGCPLPMRSERLEMVGGRRLLDAGREGSH